MSILTGGLKVRSSFAQAPVNIPGANNLQTSQTVGFAVQPVAAGVADGADLKHTKTYTLSGAVQSFDLYSGALLDVYGYALVFARVRSIEIINLATTDGNDVLFGYPSGGVTNAWTNFISCPGQFLIKASSALNQGIFAMTAPNTTGWAVTSTNRLFQLDPGANTLQVSVEITGSSV